MVVGPARLDKRNVSQVISKLCFGLVILEDSAVVKISVSDILMTGGTTEVHISHPKNPNFRICLPKKIPPFFSIPKRIPHQQ